MKWIVEKLRKEADHKIEMIGTTAHSDWDQAEWDERERVRISELQMAAKILEAHMPRPLAEHYEIKFKQKKP